MATAKKNVINANIILYGPRGAGKTSNLQFIHRKVKQSQRGQIVPMQQEGYPEVAYEFLPMELGELNGYDTNLYIYTAPAHPDGSETRHNLLNEAAGVVFIVDSSNGSLDDNIECLTTLKDELRFWEIDYDSFPIVFEYNKRDAADALSIDELETQLNPEGKPYYEARAAEGEGVRDTFARICKMAVKKVRGKLVTEELEANVAPAPASNARTTGGTSKSAKPSSPAAPPPAASAPGLAGKGKAKGKAAPIPSDQTINEAPPPRDDEEYESPAAVDDIMVYDSDRPSLEEGAAAGFGESDMAKNSGASSRITSSKGGKSGGASSAPAASGPAAGPTASAAATPASTSKATPSAKPVEAPVAASPVVESNRPTPVRAGEDFLKTSFSFGEQDDQPMLMGMLEAGDAEEVEGFGSDEDDEDGVQSGEFRDNSDGAVVIAESPALAAISLAQLSSDDLNINTYVEEEDDDDDGPVINLGMRAVVAEEMELEDEMMLDDEPQQDLEASSDEEESAEELQASAPARAAEAASEMTGETLAQSDIAPLSAAAEDDEDEEDERSIIATPADLAREGIVQPTSLKVPVHSLESELSAISPVTEEGEDEEEVFTSGRVTIATPSEAQSAQALDATAPSADFVAPSERAPVGAVAEEEPSEPDPLPDMAIAPLEEESLRAADGGSELASAEEAGSEFEMVTDPVFETMVDEAAVEQLAADSSERAGRSEIDGVGAAGAGITVRDEDEEVFEEGTEPESLESAEKASAPHVTGWGEVQRVDAQTLVLPVSVRLPGASSDVQLAVTLKVEMLLQAFVGHSPADTNPKSDA